MCKNCQKYGTALLIILVNVCGKDHIVTAPPHTYKALFPTHILNHLHARKDKTKLNDNLMSSSDHSK